MSPDKSDIAGRQGILGGTFDPIHLGHLGLAIDCCRTAKLTGVTLMPSFRPPHRPAGCDASFEDRYGMASLAAESYPEVDVSPIESELPGEGYTIKVIMELKKRYPETRFCFIMGADNVRNMVDWYQPDRIFEELPVLVGVRPGYSMDVAGLPTGFQFTVVESKPIDVSATRIRSAVRRGAPLEELETMVPLPVARFILEHKLYRT